MALGRTSFEIQADIDWGPVDAHGDMTSNDAKLLGCPVIEPRSYPGRVLNDRHSFHQLLLGLGGHAELDVGGRGLRVSPGVLATVASGDHRHLAEASFARQFRALMSVSPHAWLIGERLQRARHLMLTTDALLTGIALACGFADAAHFSRVFHEHHHESPRSWRKRLARGQV